jgi:hypothetical protein
MTIQEALKLAIQALNQARNFDTLIPNPERPQTNLSSYRLIPMLEKALKEDESKN